MSLRTLLLSPVARAAALVLATGGPAVGGWHSHGTSTIVPA
ncbi:MULTISPECIES: hypothetical protein [unclassified Streptomyces]|nr:MULTISPECIES: hypothetical protein [unclassified Streptomyces]MCU4746283.1 hypothetical protein [Streptomyces sp. G-5]